MSDGSGWAMIPTSAELKLQYQQMIHKSGMVVDGTVSASANGAVEEVGNAIVPPASKDGSAATAEGTKSLWLRILPRNGVVVSCPPPPPNLNATKSFDGSSIGPTNSRHEDDLARGSNSATSTFIQHSYHNGTSRRGVFPAHPTLLINPVIPCGIVVEVEPWKEYSKEANKPGSYDALQPVSVD